MSGNFILLGLVIILVCTGGCVAVYRLIFKKNILFKISLAILPSHMALVILGFLAGTIQSLFHFIWLVPLALVSIFITYYWLSKMIQIPMQKMSKHITSLSEGNVGSQYQDQSVNEQNEIAQISRSLVKLTGSLKNITFFAKEIGQGNLNVKYDLLGKDDTLGESLINMQGNLLQAEEDKKTRQEEDNRRNWITAGIAEFAELLRGNTHDIRELCDNIISNLIKYTGANQGGVFILNEDDPNHHYLELMACYAYDRRKYVNKNIELGEGLVGACFLEKEPIYITQIPNGYMQITSGLGEDDPRALLIVPMKLNDVIYGVIEIATFTPFDTYEMEFIEKVAESIASTISMVKVNIRTNNLLETSKIQAEEMAAQEEELRQNLEELQATQEELGRKQEETEGINQQLDKEKIEIKTQIDLINQIFPCIVLSDQLIILDVNLALAEMLDIDGTSITGKHINEILGSGKEIEHKIKSQTLSGHIVYGQMSVNTPSGTKPVNYRACPVYDEDRNISRVALLCINYMDNNEMI